MLTGKINVDLYSFFFYSIKSKLDAPLLMNTQATCQRISVRSGRLPSSGSLTPGPSARWRSTGDTPTPLPSSAWTKGVLKKLKSISQCYIDTRVQHIVTHTCGILSHTLARAYLPLVNPFCLEVSGMIA